MTSWAPVRNGNDDSFIEVKEEMDAGEEEEAEEAEEEEEEEEEEEAEEEDVDTCKTRKQPYYTCRTRLVLARGGIKLS